MKGFFFCFNIYICTDYDFFFVLFILNEVLVLAWSDLWRFHHGLVNFCNAERP